MIDSGGFVGRDSVEWAVMTADDIANSLGGKYEKGRWTLPVITMAQLREKLGDPKSIDPESGAIVIRYSVGDIEVLICGPAPNGEQLKGMWMYAGKLK